MRRLPSFATALGEARKGSLTAEVVASVLREIKECRRRGRGLTFGHTEAVVLCLEEMLAGKHAAWRGQR